MAPPSRWLRVRIRIDRVVAAALTLLTAPIIALLALLIRRHDGGPPLIQVPRVGAAGVVFGMWKLRSMRVESADGRAAGAALTSSDDDRVTPIGRRMRALHLDELPQLFNVVRGQMCLLGPRPEAPEYVEMSDDTWNTVLAVPPGIAGPTQLIVGDWERVEIDRDTTGMAYRHVVVPVKLAIDKWYIGEAGPTLDLLVLWSLAAHVMPGGSVGALRRLVGAEVPDADLALQHDANARECR